MPSVPVIELKSLVKTFDDHLAINGVSFSINKGEVFGILGPNGAGKTTLLNMIAGLVSPNSGEILIDYNLVADGSSGFPSIGYCTQKNIFWPDMTCIEQCMFMASMYKIPRSKAREYAHFTLERLGLTGDKNTLASRLSGGMKRRLNIALAVVNNPGIVIFDEPEIGLDPQSRVLVREFIKDYAVDRTVIVTTHNMDEADRLSDRVAILDKGNILVIDKPHNLKKSIGEGDVLHITIDKQTKIIHQELLKTLPNQVLLSIINDQELSIRSTNLINYMPIIAGQITANGGRIMNMEMRANTLEDVFIHLTGRSLRKA